MLRVPLSPAPTEAACDSANYNDAVVGLTPKTYRAKVKKSPR
jgi:hypothetical protein